MSGGLVDGPRRDVPGDLLLVWQVESCCGACGYGDDRGSPMLVWCRTFEVFVERSKPRECGRFYSWR